ncbi:MAG TPA: non-ribosomal peptide synthase/polyketide synthase, partial [Herpetosiphonaceae bacterium]
MPMDTQNAADLSADDLELLDYLLEEEGLEIADQQRIMPRAHHCDLPLAFAQQRLWFLDRFQPGSSAYHMVVAVRLHGALDPAALACSLAAVVARHESLRTTFALLDDQPVQVIAPSGDVPLPVVNVSTLPAAERDAMIAEAVEAEIARPFDLQIGPLLRARLLRLSETDHILILTLHHIVSDGWSQSILLRELTTFYRGATRGEAVTLPPLPIQYADYALWQRAWLQGAVVEQQLAYWREQLAGIASLDLPMDYPRPPIVTDQGAHLALEISSAVSQALRDLSQQLGATLFMTLLAAFQTLLHRYSGQDDIAVGSPVAGRSRPELEGLIGCFANTLVLRSRVVGRLSFAELVAQVQAVCLDAYAHQDVPFEVVVDALQPERDLSRPPLVQVMFVLQNTPRATIELDHLTFEPLVVERHTAKLDLALTLTETATGLQGRFEYRTDLFAPETIARLAGHFQTFLQAMVANPAQQIDRLPLLSRAEEQLLLVEWPATAAPYPRDGAIQQLVAAQVARTPEAVALVCGGEHLSYGELEARANQAAWYLHQLGVRSEAHVGICMEPSFAMIVALLAILKAGAAYVPLDPAYPSERLRWLCEESQVALVLTQPHLRETLPPSDIPIVCLDGEWTAIAAYPSTDPHIPSHPDQVAYLLYTSGSTGTPKGILVAHRGVLNNLTWRQQTWPLSSADRVLLNFSISFDPSVWTIFWPLSVGAQLVLVPSEVRADSAALVRALAEQEISVFAASPSQHAALLQEPGISACTRLRHVVSGGERLSADVQAQFFATLGATLCNAYGPTEATIETTFWICPREEERQAALLGRPLPNVQVYVLDGQRQPVPIGVAGEIYIGGVGLARGYHGRPDLTAERFVPHPFSDTPGARLYQTGDQARYRADGNLEFLGRIDQQIKLRGFRIELGEIEAALRKHLGVGEAVLLVRDDQRGDPRLVAYVTPTLDATLTAADLRGFLQTRLPAYMVPSTFVCLATFPLTPNGKVDRAALPAPELDDQGAASFVAPQSPLEELVAGVWAEVLGRGRVGQHDNFFDLGGHSLLATQVMARLRRSCGVDLPVRQLFDTPTVAALAAALAAAPQHLAGGELPPLVPLVRDGRPLPLSFAQQRLWFIHHMQPEHLAYTIPIALRLIGALDHRAAHQSVCALVARHEALRTTFAYETDALTGQPVQVIHPAAEVPLPLIDLQAEAATARAAEMQRLVRVEAQRSFDLSTGPLLRATLVRLAADEHVLLLTLHHIVADGWSMDVLVRDLVASYRALTTETTLALPALPIQYADYAIWQQQWLQGPILEQQLDYWRHHLADLPVLAVPTDYARPPSLTERGAMHRFGLPSALRDGLVALSRREGATLFMTLLAAFQVLLARWSGQDDIVVGTPIANRTRLETEGVIGFFVNTLALRTRLDGQPSFRKVLGRVRETTVRAYAHQDVPFELVVDAIEQERDLSRSPLFQVMFVLQNTPRATVDLPDLTVELLTVEHQTAKFDLTLSVQETAHELVGGLEYRTDLFEAATIERMAAHFQTLLEAIVADPSQRIDRLPLLTRAEQQQMLHDWNATDAPFPQNQCLHHLIEAQAARTPDAPALVCGDECLTYAELNQRANQLAHHLQACGVAPDVCVGLYLTRTLDFVVAALGVLKAGGAYLPLDPAYPPDRLQFMLADAQVSVLLTQHHLAPLVPADTLHAICLDTAWPTIAQQPHTPPRCAATAEHLAYVIYTSGSTGQPKGVAVPHRGLLNLVTWHQRTYALTPADRAPLLASLAFDASVWELWPYLVSGVCVYLPREEIRADVRALLAWLIEHAITLCFLPTPLAEAVLATPQAAQLRLRALLTGGDVLHAQDWSHLPFAVTNHYGPTENTVVTTCGAVKNQNTTLPPIGRPIANTQVYLLDPQLQPVPIGVAGQLYIGGESLARGYLNRPDLTAEKFVPNPFGAGRLYRTGDLARYLPDGRIDFLERIDQQVKLRGFRIELGEIEATLRQHEAVQNAVVLVRDERLVAYVVPKQNREPRTKNQEDGSEAGSRSPNGNPVLGSSDLRGYLRARLPEYMVPSAFVVLDALPLTPNGKVDRKALPAPERHPGEESSFVAPRTPVETTLARIWAEVLRIEPVGVQDNFFALGGDSILSIQVIARATQAGLGLTPKQLFQHQTIAELALVVDTAPLVTAEQGIVTGPVPLTPIQHWFFADDQPEPHHFNQAVLLQVQQPLDPALLDQAVQHLLVHHDALRLRVTRTPSGWQQRIVALDDTPLVTTIDLTNMPLAEQSMAITAAATDIQASLDLSSGPLLRVSAFDLGAEQPGRLLIVIHHLAVDAVSWSILLADLHSAYAQLQQGAVVTLPSKTTAFKAWAERLVDYAHSPTLHDRVAYWLQIARQPVPPMPSDWSDGANTQASIARIRLTLSAAETHALLHDVPRAYHTQINDVLLTALTLAWTVWSGTATLRLDLEGHGREELFAEVDLTRTVGWFTTLFPVVLDLGTVREPGAALKTIKEQLRAIPQRGIGYGLLRYLAPELVRDRFVDLPAAEVAFNYLGQLDQAIAADGWLALAAEDAGPVVSPLARRRHLLEVSGFVAGGQLHLSWAYSSARHRRATIERLVTAYQAALQALIAHCQAPDVGGYTPSDFPLARLDQAALDRIVGAEREIEDLYPLSPMQQGMLFHTVAEGGSGVYVEQLTCVLEGSLDRAAFQHAWATVVEHHPVFRTAFVWEGLDAPLQIVRQRAEVRWTNEDWRGLSPDVQEVQLTAYLDADRRRGFALDVAPLLRLALFRIGADRYAFVWSHHHLLLDGWSLPLVFDEVVHCYERLARGQELPLVRPRPYRDYIVWLQQQDLARAEAFWRQQLQGVTAPTPFGVDQRASRERTPSGQASIEVTLSELTTTTLQALVRQQGLTMNTVVQGAWAMLLSRYSGEQDIVYGTTVSGRPADLPGVEQMVGLFINTLPVRVRVDPHTPLVPWLHQLQAQHVELRQYEYSPLVQIHGWSDVPRGQPLFESIVVFENYPMETAAQPQRASLRISDIEGVEQTNYPLSIAAMVGQQLRLRLTYDCARFDSATIARLGGHLETLLTAIANAPEQRLADLPLLNEAERQQVLTLANERPATYPHTACLHDEFAAQAARTPDAVALIGEDACLSYAEVNRRANQLAQHLHAIGVLPETRVGVFLSRSVDAVIALLAVLKAGGCYVPLDPTYPQARLAFMLTDAQVAVVLTQTALRDQLPVTTAPRCCLDTLVLDGYPTTPPPAQILPDHLVYVIYTSGSTGQPKGVLGLQRGVVNRVQWMWRAYPFAPGERCCQKTALSFVDSVWEIFGPLLCGVPVSVIADDVVKDPLLLVRTLSEQRITRIVLVPSLLRAILDTHPRLHDQLPQLTCWVSSGEALPLDLARRFAEQMPHATLLNLYGSSEVAADVTCFDVRQLADHDHMPIGRPLANMAAYVLDARMQLVPIGVPGELYIGGAGLARGYFNRPDLTAEKFVPNPFDRESGARLYRMGDRARWRVDGQLEYLGRIDQQIKLRGFRIELGEIEAVLRQHAGVRDAVVLLREGRAGDGRLVAYVLGDGQVSSEGLVAVLGARLPEYMVPSAFVFLEALPLTPNGKVDRRALPEPAWGGNRDESLIGPRTPVEELIASVWMSVLGVEHVSIHDNFFALGGHSLLATQVVSRLRQLLNVEVPLRLLFEAPTIASFAAEVVVQHVEASLPLVPVPHDGGPLPLSFAQQRLWFLDQLQPGSRAYHIPLVVRLHGAVDPAAMQQSLAALIARHESLRTTFAVVDEQPVQVIAATVAVPLPVVVLPDLAAAEIETAIEQVIRAEVQQPFDLQQGPLLRATLLRLAECEHILILTLHHIISDGWSQGVLLRELTILYRGFVQDEPVGLPELPIQYADYTAWQRTWLQGDVLEQQLSYWRTRLANLTPLDLPTDYPRSARSDYPGAHVAFQLSPTLTTGLQRLSQQLGSTLFMTLLAAFQTLLYRYSGQTDITVGTPIAGRVRRELEHLIGFFVNTLVLRTDLSGHPTFAELVARVRVTALDAYAHQDLPFELIVEAVQPQRDLSRSPLFQVMFTLQNTPRATIDLDDLSFESVIMPATTAKFDLTLSVSEAPHALYARFEYRTDLFAADMIARMAAQFQVLLAAIVTDPEERIDRLALLTEAEYHQLLHQWNATSAPFPQDQCIHHLVMAQARSTPDAPSLIVGDECLTYADLDRQANQLAHHLHRLGVGPDMRVGICLPRSLDLVVALLGVLKAGGCYVPLDPTSPQERLAAIVADAQIGVVVTHESLRHAVGIGLLAERVVCLDAERAALNREPHTNPPTRITPDHLAYVIYTSGSTGRPKGVAVAHRQLLNYVSSITRQLDLPPGASFATVSTFAADLGNTAIFPALCGGGCLHVIGEERIMDPDALAAYLHRHAIDCLKIVPSHLAALLTATHPAQVLPRKLLVLGGEAAGWELIARVQALAPACRILNHYGPTETTVGVLTYPVTERASWEQRGRLPLGRPLENTQILLLDRSMQLVPIGVAGELYVGGVQLARGYLHRPDLTAERFVPHPFSQTPGQRL